MTELNFKTKPSLWPKKDMLFLAEAYADRKWSIKDIAKRLGKSEVAIARKARRMGIHRPSEMEDYLYIEKLRKDGLSIRKTAEVTGFSRFKVWKGIHKLKELREADMSQLYCPCCGPRWKNDYNSDHRCVTCGHYLRVKDEEKVKTRSSAPERIERSERVLPDPFKRAAK